MKAGSENRRKTIMAGGLGSAALLCIIYAYYQLFGGAPNPVAVAPPSPVVAGKAVTSAPVVKTTSTTAGSSMKSSLPGSNAPGVAATKMATTSASLDPTLDQKAMLRTESLVYSGSGRNIFSATYTPPVAAIVKPKFPVRVQPTPPVVPQGPPPIPPPPPINLKFFGTAKRPNGLLQAFVLQGDNVYLAGEGDIVARKYKIVSITANSIQVTDLQNSNTQTLPLQLN